jgi:hypothetical protein
MKKQLVIIGIVVILVSVGLSGCSSSPKDKLIGTWKYQSGGGGYHVDTYTFYNNRTYHWIAYQPGSLIPYEGWNEYSVTENTLTDGTSTYSFTVSDDNQELILDGVVYQRQ